MLKFDNCYYFNSEYAIDFDNEMSTVIISIFKNWYSDNRSTSNEEYNI